MVKDFDLPPDTYGNAQSNADAGNNEPHGSMHRFYDTRVLHSPDSRGANEVLKPLLRDLVVVYERLCEMEQQNKKWPDRVNAIITDNTYLKPIREFHEKGKDAIAGLKHLRNTRCAVTPPANIKST